MPAEKKGNYFKDKQEAVEFYRNSEENLKDKPEWMIECMIDFACQYPNYKEYLEVEGKVKNGEELTAKQKKKYGHMKWDKVHVEYNEGDVVPDCVDIKEEGTYDDLTDPEVREKYNKYDMKFGEVQEPEDKVTFKRFAPDGEECTASALITDLDARTEEDPSVWKFTKVGKPIEPLDKLGE